VLVAGCDGCSPEPAITYATNTTILDTGCPDCNRREIALHTAQVELQHKLVVIAAMQQQIELLKQRVERGKK